jgi:hypothetical protein
VVIPVSTLVIVMVSSPYDLRDPAIERIQ